MTDWLSTAQAAKRAGVTPASWRGMVARGAAPPPDDHDDNHPVNRRAPRWRPETIDAWLPTRRRPGRPPAATRTPEETPDA